MGNFASYLGGYAATAIAGHRVIVDADRKRVDERGRAASERRDAVNMGIAVVVPIQHIMGVINHPELSGMRDAIDEAEAQSRAPVEDSVQDDEEFTRGGFMDALKKVSEPDEPQPDEASE